MEIPLSGRPSGFYPATDNPEVWSSINPLRENLFFILCRPFLRIMRLGGMFFMPLSYVRQRIGDGRSPALIDAYFGNRYARGCFELLSHAYCLLVFLLIGVFCGKTIFTIVNYTQRTLHGHITNENLGDAVQAVVYAVWIIQILLTHAIFLWACWREEGLAQLMAFWEQTHFRCLDANCRYLGFRRRLTMARNKFIILGVFNLLLQLCSILLPMLVPVPIYATLRNMLFGGFMPDNPWIIALNVLGAVYTAFVYILPIFFFAMVCHFILYDFAHICHEVRKLQTTREIYRWLEWLRLRHNAVCLFVEMADGIFSPYIALTLFCNVFQILMGIFVTYQDGQKAGGLDLLKTLSTTFWMLQYLVQLFILLGAGTALNNAARSPMQHLYRISQDPAAIPPAAHPELFLLRLQTFLTKLTCNEIGFTAWRLFLINYEAIRLLFGTFVTYEVLIFLLQMDLRRDDQMELVPSCNCVRSSHDELDPHPVPAFLEH